MRKFLPAFLLLGLAGCAPFHWNKPGIDQATLDRDSGECRTLARNGAFGYYSQTPGEPYAGGAGLSPYTGMRMSSANVWQYSSMESGLYAMEDRLHARCMRHRGYDRIQENQQKA